MEIDPQAVKSGFDALKAAVETIKSFKEMFRGDPAKHAAASLAIENAEREVKFAEAQLAQALGYRLCRAHFPPVPMLRDRVDPEYVEVIDKCAECCREDPPLEYFAQKRRIDASFEEHNRRMERADNWTTR